MISATAGHRPTSPNNLLGLDLAAEAEALGPPCVPILDAHLHINGPRAARLFRDIAHSFGVTRFVSMTRLDEIDDLRTAFGDSIRFIATADYKSDDVRHSLGAGYASRLREFHARGARIAKFWCAPRVRDTGAHLGDPSLFDLDAESRRPALEEAASLGMTFLAHVADPDTWFASRYANSAIYGTKRSHHDALERALDRYQVPWVVAHMGGWPEDLQALDGLLARHPHLSLDASATKWMVRELCRHGAEELRAFMIRWRGRILFGSDTVTTDDHLRGGEKVGEMSVKAASEAQARELYASRFWTLRVLWETSWRGRSPIEDPDLLLGSPAASLTAAEAAVEAPLSPPLIGCALPRDLLAAFYAGAAERLFWRDASKM